MADSCKDCGENENIHAKGLCLKCYGKHSMRKYRLLHPEEDKQRKRDWYQAHKQEFCLVRKRSRILKKYDLSLEEYQELKINQKNKCLICNEATILVLDHNHKTGEIRGMLCNACNRGLGYFKDNPEVLIKAARYLLDRKKQEGKNYASTNRY